MTILSFLLTGCGLFDNVPKVFPETVSEVLEQPISSGFQYNLNRHDEFFSLEMYEPFGENTHVALLSELSTLRFTDNLPRLDGATALYPLYAAFARAVYPEGFYYLYSHRTEYWDMDDFHWLNNARDEVICTTTAGAFENLINGLVDIIFIADISEAQQAKADELGLELVLTPIGLDAFVFFVNVLNPVNNLNIADIIGIYSGMITNWKEIGGDDSIILAYQRSENSGSQTALESIMGDVPIMEPLTYIIDQMGTQVEYIADYENHPNALGYSFLFYVQTLFADERIKLLSIEGVEPSFETIISGKYPFTGFFYAITVVREPETEEDVARFDNARLMIEWILSPQGQYLVDKTGFVPLHQ
jgi:phosphate transport system substrate-binding protein